MAIQLKSPRRKRDILKKVAKVGMTVVAGVAVVAMGVHAASKGQQPDQITSATVGDGNNRPATPKGAEPVARAASPPAYRNYNDTNNHNTGYTSQNNHYRGETHYGTNGCQSEGDSGGDGGGDSGGGGG